VLIFSVGGYFMSETFSLGEEQPASKPVAMSKMEILCMAFNFETTS
jgi:hypothetical protein